jgi:hypothetical protein
MYPMPFSSQTDGQVYVVESDMFKDTHGNPTVAFCLWCGENFYSSEEVEMHHTAGTAACLEFQEFKRKS